MNKWQTYKIKDLTQSFSGGTPLTDRPEFYQNGDIPFITSSDLNQQFIDSVPHYITKQGLESSSAKIVEPQTLLLALYGATAGTAAITHIRGAINQAILAFSKSKIDIKFLYYLLSEKKPYILHTYTQGGQPNLSAQIVNNLSIYVPTDCHEQQKIVEVLETWDKAIQLTRKLIEQKELQKKYLMQQLLSGRIRLKGFVTPWKTERLGHFKSIIIEKGTALSSQNIEKGPIPVIAGGQTVPYYHKYWTHDVPCITISASGAYAGFVWLHSGKIWASDCSVIYTRGYDLNFLYYCLKSQQNHLFYLQTGGAQAHIYPSEIRSLKIPNISLQEQQAIVQLLNINFQEIDLLCQKLAKLEEQKKGLMQVLLTGKVRLQVGK